MAQLADGAVVTSIEQVTVDDELTVRVSDGTIGVRTQTKEEMPHG